MACAIAPGTTWRTRPRATRPRPPPRPRRRCTRRRWVTHGGDRPAARRRAGPGDRAIRQPTRPGGATPGVLLSVSSNRVVSPDGHTLQISVTVDSQPAGYCPRRRRLRRSGRRWRASGGRRAWPGTADARMRSKASAEFTPPTGCLAQQPDADQPHRCRVRQTSLSRHSRGRSTERPFRFVVVDHTGRPSRAVPSREGTPARHDQHQRSSRNPPSAHGRSATPCGRRAVNGLDLLRPNADWATREDRFARAGRWT